METSLARTMCTVRDLASRLFDRAHISCLKEQATDETRSRVRIESDKQLTFWRDRVWLTMRTCVLTNDSRFAFTDRREFPDVICLPPGRGVGCDGRVMLKPRQAPVTGP
jgi:hypothetical protein